MSISTDLRKISLKAVFCLTIAVALTGCKIVIIVPPGGNVIDADGNVICLAGQTCEIDVVDFHYQETFSGVPDDGYMFLGWKREGLNLCGGFVTSCSIATDLFEGNQLVFEILVSDWEWPLVPVFKPFEIVDPLPCENAPEESDLNFDLVFKAFQEKFIESRISGDCFFVDDDENDEAIGELAFFTETAPVSLEFNHQLSQHAPGMLNMLFETTSRMSFGGTDDHLQPKNALVLYIDADGVFETGHDIGGRFGADYRTLFHWGCPRYQGEEYVASFAPAMQYWGVDESWHSPSTGPGYSAVDKDWITVPYAVDPSSSHLMAFFSGISRGILHAGLSPLGIVRLEKVDQDCIPTKTVFGTSPVFRLRNLEP